MKNLTFISMDSEPEITPHIHLHRDLIEDLSQNGYMVNLIVPTPSRGLTKEEIKVHRKQRYIEKENIKTYRLKTINHRLKIYWKIFRYAQFTVKALIQALKLETDILYVETTPPLLLGLIGVILSKIKRVPMVYGVQDIFPDTAVNSGKVNNDKLINILHNIEKLIYNKAFAIITINKDMKENLINKRIEGNKIYIIYNWVDTNKVTEISKDKNRFIKKYNLNKDYFYVMYAGNIGIVQNVGMILDVAEIVLNHKYIKFLIVGDGIYKEKLMYECNKRHLDNVEFFPLEKEDMISDVYSAGNINLVTLVANVIKNAMPSKTGAILACGRPIIASVDKDSDYYRMINNNNLGLSVDANDCESMAAAILDYCDNVEKYELCKKNSRNFAELYFSRKVCTSKYIEIFEEIMTKEMMEHINV